MKKLICKLFWHDLELYITAENFCWHKKLHCKRCGKVVSESISHFDRGDYAGFDEAGSVSERPK